MWIRVDPDPTLDKEPDPDRTLHKKNFKSKYFKIFLLYKWNGNKSFYILNTDQIIFFVKLDPGLTKMSGSTGRIRNSGSSSSGGAGGSWPEVRSSFASTKNHHHSIQLFALKTTRVRYTWCPDECIEQVQRRTKVLLV